MFRWLFTLLLMAFLFVSGKEPTGYRERIDRLCDLPRSVMVDSVGAVLTDLLLENNAVNLHYSEKMLLLQDVLSPQAYLLILRHYARTAESDNQALLDRCIQFAIENDLNQYLSSLYVLKTSFFRQEGVYDSAMIYTLMTRDNVEKYYNQEEEANVLHLLGDLYYSTGLYEIARDYYVELTEVKGSADVWKSWRERVVRNNLAQIEMKKGNYYLALGLFKESLAELGNPPKTNADSIAAAYILLMMADNYLHIENWRQAEAYAEKTLAFHKRLNDAQGIFRSYLLKTTLAVSLRDIPKAVNYLDSAMFYSNIMTINPEEQAELFLQQSRLYEMQNKTHLAFEKFKLFAVLKDSLNKGLSAARIQQIQAGNDFASLNLQNVNLRKQRSLYLALMIAALVIVIIVVLHNFSIRQKNRKLVALSINQVKNGKSKPRVVDKAPYSALHPAEIDPKMTELMAAFNELIMEKKFYLDSTISLDKIANELGTNRSYLSKAINKEMNQGFSSVINSLRVKEAISIISQSIGKKIIISELAEKVGFNSRTAFVAAFNKHTGMLPSSFISNFKSLCKSATPPKYESE